MGQYFEWVNLDKRELLDSSAFADGLELYETSYVGSERTGAALTLLAGDWAHDAVVFMGDYCSPADSANLLMRRIAREYGERGAYDQLADEFSNIAGGFAAARGKTEWVYDDIAQDTVSREYQGTFDLEVSDPRYLVNLTKGEYVDRRATMVWYVKRTPSYEVSRFDPTPLLLATEGALDGFEDGGCGPWLGDDVYASDTCPGEGFVDSTRKYVYTIDDDDIPVYATDRQIEAVWRRRIEDYEGLSEDEIDAIRALLRRC